MSTTDGAFELEGMVSALTVLRVTTPDLNHLQTALEAKLPDADELLQAALLVVDLTAIDGHPDAVADKGRGGEVPPLCPIALESIVTSLRGLGLSPVAVRNLRAERAEEARRLGLAQVRGSSVRKRRAKPRTPETATAGPTPAEATATTAAPEETPTDREAPPVDPALQSPTLMLQQPVRGGQVIYAKGADALALGAVNPGGELIADGNIHVYGTLRGRALAGAHGDTNARIFCTRLEAELVSVAGVYLQAEDIPESHRGRPAHIHLDGDKLVVTDL